MALFLRSWFLALALSACCHVAFPAHSQPVSNATEQVDLKLADYLHQVLQHNESI
jgi:hypothetical protein